MEAGSKKDGLPSAHRNELITSQVRTARKELKTVGAMVKTAEVTVQEIAVRFAVSRSTLYRNGLA
jgi:DNA invertase Pin-like site-specific DNA recombinase